MFLLISPSKIIFAEVLQSPKEWLEGLCWSGRFVKKKLDIGKIRGERNGLQEDIF